MSSLFLRPLIMLCVLTATLVSASATESLYSRLHRALHRGTPRQMPSLRSREIPRRIYPTLDVARAVTGVDRLQSAQSDYIPFTGKGVTIAVIDGGIDPTHIAFSDRGNGSRVVSYLRTESALESASGDTEATCYTDMTTLSPDDIDTGCGGHGTHTAGIAAGTSQVSPYHGIAPDAELYLVSMGSELYDDEIALGMRSALDYAGASGRPLVMNFSLGSTVGSHRGDNPLTEMLREYSPEGRIALFAAGNDGVNPLSLARNFATHPGELKTAMAKRFTGTPAPSFYTELYSADERELQVALTVIELGERYREVWRSRFLTARDFDEQGSCIILSPDGAELLPGLSRYFSGVLVAGLEADPEAPFAMGIAASFADVDIDYPYVLGLVVTSPQGADMLMLTDYQQAYLRSYGVEGYVTGNASHSISDYCTSPLVISVGSWNARASWTDTEGNLHQLDEDFYGAYGAPGTYSSYGSVRGSAEPLPHLLAPGTDVISAIPPACTDQPAYTLEASGRTHAWTAMTGTSMATPLMAGIAALWLEACPTLTRDEIIEVIAACSRHDDATLAAPQGSAMGKVNAYDGLRYILTTLSVPGTVVDNPPSRLMTRVNPGGLVECVMPMPCSEGNVVAVTPSGAIVATAPLTGGIARFTLPKGVYIIRATSPLGTASARIVIP